jgi:3-hydroxyisobutyrate dehydrogenase
MDATGFIGIGLMGLPMCQKLLANGINLTVWNRSELKTKPLVAAGAKYCTTPAKLASQVRVLILCLADDAAVESVCFAENGIFSGAKHGLVIVDHSSISPTLTQRLHQQASGLGISWIDAPVSGGVVGAEQGRLVIMAGGDAASLNHVRPLLSSYAQRISHMGASGAGQVSKLCNQLIVAANSLLIAETVALAEKAGVDASRLAPALAGGFADSLPFQILAPRMATQQFEPVQWRVATLLKDLNNAIAHASSLGLDTPVATAAQRQLNQQANNGLANHDLSSIILLYQALKTIKSTD